MVTVFGDWYNHLLIEHDPPSEHGRLIILRLRQFLRLPALEPGQSEESSPTPYQLGHQHDLKLSNQQILWWLSAWPLEKREAGAVPALAGARTRSTRGIEPEALPTRPTRRGTMTVVKTVGIRIDKLAG